MSLPAYKCVSTLDEQAHNRCRLMIKQIPEAEGGTGNLKRQSQWEWIKAMNSIVHRAQENFTSELISA
ncbi:MAG: TnpV protein [Lachnospiraceae bacterium]|nr:TnpV protein [Lachnospiraceae bacterium]